MPALPYAEEIDAAFEHYKEDPFFSEQLDGMDIPKLSGMRMDMDMSGDGSYEMPADILEKLQNSDVTTITDNTVELVERMFEDMSPMAIAGMTKGIDSGISGIDSGIDAMEAAMAQGATPAVMMQQALGDMKELSRKLTELKEAVPAAFEEAGDNYADSVRELAPEIEDMFQETVNSGYRDMYLFQVASNALGLLLLMFYKEPRKKREE